MKMINNISQCNKNRTDEAYCSLTPTCKGWGCKFLTTVIEEVPETEEEKARLFAKVYREAKHKGVIDCPAYRSIFIDEVLENIGHITNEALTPIY